MFVGSTRRKLLKLGAVAKGTTNPLTFQIPQTGYLSKIYLSITGAVAGTLSAQNALGFSSVVRRIRLQANNGISLMDLSGPGYHFLLRDHIDAYGDPVPWANGRTAITATTFDVSMVLPVMINSRDTLGAVNLQNEETVVTLQVDFEDDAVVATGATVTATVQPTIEIFTIPERQEDRLSLRTIHQILEDARVISGAGQLDYALPRGNTYLYAGHMIGAGVSGSDLWTTADLVVNQSDTLEAFTVQSQRLQFGTSHGRDRLLGTVHYDFAGTSGLGMFSSLRDAINSQAVTEFLSRLNITGAVTLRTLRRQLVEFSQQGKE
jgi:hypothetical protein